VPGARGGPGIVAAVTEPEVIRATPSARQRVVDTVVAAFAHDPAFRFFFDRDEEQSAAFAGFLFDRRVGHDAVWIVDGGASVAMWEPYPTDSSSGDGELSLPSQTLARLAEYDAVVHKLLPRTPHAYLGVLATHPDFWGRRWGRTVMAPGMRQARTDGLPAYLETTTENNVEMYRRAGWEVTEFVTVATVPVWVMRAQSQQIDEPSR
jgi:ribosomal protein S18 acetylase RimI-like enzyme